MNGCENQAGYGRTNQAICDVWLENMVTVSPQDTRETREQALVEYEAWRAACDV